MGSADATDLKNRRKVRVRGVAILFGLAVALLGALSGESTYVVTERVTSEPRTREVVDTCEIVEAFQSFRKKQPISRAQCQEIIDSLTDYEDVIEATFRTENYEEQIVSTVTERDWGSEIQSRGWRFVVGGILAVALIYVVIGGLTFLSRLKTESIGTTAGGVKRNKVSGLVGALDFGFERFLTPVIVRIFYALTTIAVALGAVVFWYSTVFEYSDETASEKFTKIVWVTPLSVLGATLVMLLVRLLFESVVVVFRIAEDLRRIRDK